MDFLRLLGIFDYGLVLIYGMFLSTGIAGGPKTRQQKWLIFVLCFLSLLIQSLCWLILGVDTTKQLYPLIVHLPLVLILIFVLKKQAGVAVVSVCMAYLCCQLPRWVNLLVAEISRSPLAGEICYTLSIVPIFILLRRYFVRAAHDAMTYSPQSLLLFGSLPIAYYFFDYATVVYSDALYIGIKALNEFLPTALIAFYVLFLTAYHTQAQKRTQAELQQSMLEAELKQSGIEMEGLRQVESQAAIYQHDMRHHLSMIDSLLTAGRFQQAEEYIRKVQADLDTVTPKRFCENEIVNLLCSSFSGKASRLGVQLNAKVKLPKSISVSDTALCSLLSNGLENALHAVTVPEITQKWVELYCAIKQNKLLIEVKNPYAGKVILQDGLPVSTQEGHGYGCRSIRAITTQYRGLCSFEANNQLFTLRIMIPIA